MQGFKHISLKTKENFKKIFKIKYLVIALHKGNSKLFYFFYSLAVDFP